MNTRLKAVLLAWVAGLTVASTSFVSGNGLASFADDSVSYIVQAQYFSPYIESDAAVREAFRIESNYPPMFPWILALSGAESNYKRAHILVAAFFVASCVLLYFFLIKAGEAPASALAIAILFSTTPAAWTNMLGILSENPYLMVSLATMYFHPGQSPVLKRAQIIGLSGLLIAVVMLRSVGIALAIAVGLQGLIQQLKEGRFNLSLNLAPVATLGAFCLWLVVRPAGEEGLYAGITSGLIQAINGESSAGSNLWSLLGPQIAAFIPGWRASWLLYWSDNISTRDVIIFLFLALALMGLALRAARSALDAWYIIFYIFIISIWPTSNQMVRFLYPILPFFIWYQVYAFRWLGSLGGFDFNSRRIVASCVVSIFLITLPSLSFVATRFISDEGGELRGISEFYRVPELPGAQEKARLHRDLFWDMRKLARDTPDQASIMWYSPSYIALLTGRRGVSLPAYDSDLPRKVHQSGADYVFLSALQPRRTLDKEGVQRGLPYFSSFTNLLWFRESGTGQVESVLLKIDHAALLRAIATP